MGRVHTQRRCTNNHEMTLSLTDRQDRWRCWQSQCRMDTCTCMYTRGSLVPEGWAEAIDRVTGQMLDRPDVIPGRD